MKYIAYLATGLAFTGFIFLFLWTQVKNYQSFFILSAVITGGIGFLILFLVDKKEIGEITNEFEDWKNNLMHNGVTIEVKLDECEIRSNEYREEIIKHDSNNYKALDALSGRDMREFQEVRQSVLVYKTELFGVKRTFISQVIDKDETTLQFLLSSQKTTKLYVDPLDKDNFYFDLEFL